MFIQMCIVLFVVNSAFAIKPASQNKNFIPNKSLIFNRKIQFKNSAPDYDEQSRCASVALSTDKREYIVSIQPIATKKTNHHMTLFACETLPEGREYQENGNSWDCSKFDKCGEGNYRRLFTWALDAFGIEFPEGVGYRVGGDTKIHYLVTEIHYGNVLPNNTFDNYSAYNLTMTTQELPYQVGIYNTGGDGDIPPKEKKFIIQTGCDYNLPYDSVPIFIRTHAHNIIRVMSIYLIKKEDKNQKWIELGRMSPLQKQMFYKVSNEDQIITSGDVIASRCTCNSMTRNTITVQGDHHEDEMCAFYLMFYTDYADNIYQDAFCYQNGINFDFDSEFGIKTNAPENASNLYGVKLLEPLNEISSAFH